LTIDRCRLGSLKDEALDDPRLPSGREDLQKTHLSKSPIDIDQWSMVIVVSQVC